MQNFCFCQLSMHILWRRRYGRVVDLKLPIVERARGCKWTGRSAVELNVESYRFPVVLLTLSIKL